MLTLQQIFDKGLAHIRKQGGPARDEESDKCVYRSSNGRACIVGCLIADEDYQKAFDPAAGSGVDTMIRDNPEFRQALLNSGVDVHREEFGYTRGPVRALLSSMQGVHDSGEDVSDGKWLPTFESKMADVATVHALTYTYTAPTPAAA